MALYNLEYMWRNQIKGKGPTDKQDGNAGEIFSNLRNK